MIANPKCWTQTHQWAHGVDQLGRYRQCTVCALLDYTPAQPIKWTRDDLAFLKSILVMVD